ncbi:CARDB domain-containing protein, partial [Clostridium tertium]|uniref:CARDB domain-containing protein n=1 Tax=Clostridium tertium TaxID=1559 RepID=UPI0034A1AA61
ISNNNGSVYGNWSSYIVGGTASNITLTEEGTSKIKVEVTDNAGNLNTVTSGSYQIDKTAPTATSYDVVDRQDDTFTIDIVGVSDNGGSGVKSQTVKVWIETPSGRKEKLYTPTNINSSTSRVVVNRLDYGGYSKTYNYELKLVDNVGNSRTYTSKTGTMIQNNLKANRVDIYDPREGRYVSQVISGLQYEAIVEVVNTGERQITKNFDIGFKIDGTESCVITEDKGVEKDEVKNYKFTFTAGQENLIGVKYEGIVDYNDSVYETNEVDNTASTKNPYSTPRSDNNPPIIPQDTGGKPTEIVPIITVVVDMEADYIDIVELDSDVSVTEVITDDMYRIKYRIKNNCSLSFQNLDIRNKSFNNKIYYDQVMTGQVDISQIRAGEIKTYYQEFTVPLLPEGMVEAIKTIRLDVDTKNSIKESDETNNTISKNKKVIGLKLTDYRITDVVNPISPLNYPIYTNEMPLNIKGGYNVTFMVNVTGKPDSVYANVKDSNGKNYGKIDMTKVRDIDNVRSEWTYTFAPDIDTKEGTIIITEIYANKNAFTYDYNKKESWNGYTLKIGGSAKEDIIIYRKY